MSRNRKMKVGEFMRAKYGGASVSTSMFFHGWAAALADANRLFDKPTLVAETMRGGGVTVASLQRAGVEAYDLDEIRKCMRTRRGKAPHPPTGEGGGKGKQS